MGFLNIDKPLQQTSHDVVAQVRRLTRREAGIKKVGHAGTLDPLASGVLVLCVGQATRLSEYAMSSTKQYRAQIALGVTTDTYDAEGTIVTERDVSHITQADVEAVLPQFTGGIEQVPPMYSAIKQDGKKLYELARDGIDVERPPRPVTIHELSITAWDAPHVTIDVTCSSGTYIRSLAYDIGTVLGIGGHLAGLIRTRSGSFALADAIALDDLLAGGRGWQQHLIAPRHALQDWHSRALSDDEAQDIQHGRFITRTADDSADAYIMATMPDGHLLAVLENRETHWKPHKVFPPQT